MSCSRRCDFDKCSDGKWYLTLGDFEYAEDDHDCSVYGPFNSFEAAEQELRRHSNPGSFCTDDRGTRKPPKVTMAPGGGRLYGRSILSW